jgi:hypothetical protein
MAGGLLEKPLDFPKLAHTVDRLLAGPLGAYAK